MRLISSHYAASPNVGDAVSSPFLYFDLGAHEVVDFPDLIPDCDAVIFGGGALGNNLAKGPGRAPARIKIAWGVGDTRHGQTAARPAPEGFALYGSRDWQQPGAIYAPCASCMSPLFDHPAPIEHEAVFYWNQGRGRPPVDGLPEMHNEVGFAEAIAFLASGETVVTNSYHGAFWATLIGRRVVIVDAYSSKLHGFRDRPAYARGLDWPSAAAEARAHPEALADARRTTLAFRDRVMDVLGG